MAIQKRKVIEYATYIPPNWIGRNAWEIVITISGLIIINLVFIAKAYRVNDTLNPPVAGQLGDFVGGYIGTFFVLVSVVLLYSTLRAQRLSSAIGNFETKYFEMLKMHRDNVSEIGIGKDYGRKVFVLMIREFRSILEIVKLFAVQKKQKLSEEDFFIISYFILFYGVGPNSSRLLKLSLSDYDSEYISNLEKHFNSKTVKHQIKSAKGFRYTPFEGHQSRLAHYYRHLFQTLKYIHKQTIDINKPEYSKTVRAQLTTHEQALLFINSLTPIGSVWWTDNLITDYKFVRNIPPGFFDKSEIDLESYFPDDYFEYQERKLELEAQKKA